MAAEKGMERFELEGRQCALWGDPGADTLLVQAMDARDLEDMPEQAALIRDMSGGSRFLMAAFAVQNWNGELSPWPAPPVLGRKGFDGGAASTFDFVKALLLPTVEARACAAVGRRIIGGYSLSALFALWTAYTSDLFDAVAAASPSVWYPGWLEFAGAHSMQAGCVYLSLGDTEERTRNPVLACVGDAIRAQYRMLSGAVNCSLEWNPGNHFREASLRTARAFATVMGSDLREARK